MNRPSYIRKVYSPRDRNRMYQERTVRNVVPPRSACTDTVHLFDTNWMSIVWQIIVKWNNWLTERVTDATEGTSRIARTLESRSENVETDTVQMLFAHLWDAGFDDRVKVLRAAVVIKLLAAVIGSRRTFKERNRVSPRHHRDGIDKYRSWWCVLFQIVGLENESDFVLFARFEASGWVDDNVTGARR